MQQIILRFKNIFLYTFNYMLYRVEICFDTVLMLTILHCNTIYILNIVRKRNSPILSF